MIYNVIYTPTAMEAIRGVDVLNWYRAQNHMPMLPGGTTNIDSPIVLPDWLLCAIERRSIIISESSVQKTMVSVKYIKLFADKDDWIVKEGAWINLYSDKLFRDKFKMVK